jgi:hypothetical protein
MSYNDFKNTICRLMGEGKKVWNPAKASKIGLNALTVRIYVLLRALSRVKM